mmetsp:Transcript_33447/g.40984  ORF Transcript_33447/g.40984 Transcript_33447/m.40984 type:complete len:99 (-) Transcript_33447:184-480(-)
MSGKNTRSVQVYINTNHRGNAYLDREGFLPFGKVIKGMDVVDRFYGGYGETKQGLFWRKDGRELVRKQFPKMAVITDARLLQVDELDSVGVSAQMFVS